MLEFFIFVSITTLITLFSLYVIRLKNTNLKLLLAINQTMFDVESLSKKFQDGQSPESEHLISFLNETRDVAYKYIDDVHKALLEYKEEIDYDLKNPNNNSINIFRQSFEKLQKIYPEDIPND